MSHDELIEHRDWLIAAMMLGADFEWLGREPHFMGMKIPHGKGKLCVNTQEASKGKFLFKGAYVLFLEDLEFLVLANGQSDEPES